jgi:hypothetical protein
MQKSTKEQADKSTQENKIHTWKKHTRAQKKTCYNSQSIHAWKNTQRYMEDRYSISRGGDLTGKVAKQDS